MLYPFQSNLNTQAPTILCEDEWTGDSVHCMRLFLFPATSQFIVSYFPVTSSPCPLTSSWHSHHDKRWWRFHLWPSQSPLQVPSEAWLDIQVTVFQSTDYLHRAVWPWNPVWICLLLLCLKFGSLFALKNTIISQQLIFLVENGTAVINLSSR